MTVYDTHQTLMQSLEDLALGLDTAYENADFTPPDNALWLAATIIPAGVDSLMKDSLGLDDRVGIFQISIYAPSGTGTGESLRLAETLTNYYKHGLQLDDVFIAASGRNGGRNTDAWYIIDVSINYTATTQRV